MDTPTKRCKSCLRELPLSEFYFRKDIQRYRPECKRCNLDKRGYSPYENFPDGYKRCRMCQKILPLCEFNRASRTKDGYQGKCRACQKMLKQRWHATRGQLPEQKQKARQRATKWYRKHPNHQKQRYHNNPQLILAAQHRREARKRGLPDIFTATDWTRCLDWFNHRCAYCEKPQGLLDFTKLTIDHWIPLSDPACPGTVPTNIVPACKSCNASKNDTPPEQWLLDKHGKTKGKQIINRILAYFSSIS